MSDDVFAKHRLTDAVPQPGKSGSPPGSPPPDAPGTIAEQARESQESRAAENARTSGRDRLVDLGKAHHMGGRARGRRSDS